MIKNRQIAEVIVRGCVTFLLLFRLTMMYLQCVSFYIKEVSRENPKRRLIDHHAAIRYCYHTVPRWMSSMISR